MTVIVIVFNGWLLLRGLFSLIAVAGAVMGLARKNTEIAALMVIAGSGGVLGMNLASGAPWWYDLLGVAAIALVIGRPALALLRRAR